MVKNCRNCNKEFKISPSRKGLIFCCGLKCSGEHRSKHKNNFSWRTGVSVSKETREKQRQAKLKNPIRYWLGKTKSEETRKKISIGLMGKNIGEKHWNWNGGVSSKNRMERVRFKKQIQKKVFERDDYTCQLCGVRGVDIQVDHIQSWAEYIELRFCIDNCRTLCASCHYKITFGKPMPPTIRAWGHNLFKGGTNL